MSVIFTSNPILEQIVEAAERLSTEEQQMFLSKINAKLLMKTNGTFVKYKKAGKQPTITQIDKWKHEARKEYANQ